MIRVWGKHFGPALLLAVLALFSLRPPHRVRLVRDLPPPPPPKPTPKPTPVPTPPPLKDEDFDVVRVTSNLVMVPVSVVDARGEPVLGLQLPDFRLDEEGRTQEITQIGNPDQVPLDIAIVFDVSSSVSRSRFLRVSAKSGGKFSKTSNEAGRSRGSVYYQGSTGDGSATRSGQRGSCENCYLFPRPRRRWQPHSTTPCWQQPDT